MILKMLTSQSGGKKAWADVVISVYSSEADSVLLTDKKTLRLLVDYSLQCTHTYIDYKN